jgi:aryl-alcohol dehydrogenase-like predicted oxidoreductase
LSPLRAALGFVRATAPDARIVIGCESGAQIDDTLAATRMGPPDGDVLAAVEALHADDPNIIDPRTWAQ